MKAEYGSSDDENMRDAADSRTWTFWEKVNIMSFLCLCCVLDGVDFQLLPSSFRGLEMSLHTSLSSLASLSMCQGLTLVVSCPFWGSLADHGVPRRLLMSCGCVLWGVFTILLAVFDTFVMMVILRLLNGVALGMVFPMMQSIVADIAPPEHRGRLFGIALGAQNIGVTLSSRAATDASTKIIWGFYGWRVSFAIVGVSSILVGVALYIFMVDVPRPLRITEVNLLAELALLKDYLGIPTFTVIFVQGIFGMIPWSVFSFLIIYFQYVGFADDVAGTFYMVFTLAHGVGQTLGGYVGDYMSMWSSDHGRIATAQLSVALGVPCICIITSVIHKATDQGVWYCLVLAALGLVASWCGSGCNNPVLSEIVSQRHMARVYAWSYALQSFCGMVFAPNAVAFMAEHFFQYSSDDTDVRKMSAERRATNAAALGDSIMYLSLVPWGLCFLCYASLHWVYPADRTAAALTGGK